jgi:hypothetical protein
MEIKGAKHGNWGLEGVTRCYAWSHGLDNSKKGRFFAVLHQGTIDSPEAAVKAAIVSEIHKNKKK